MNETSQRYTRIHNTVLGIMTVAAIGTIIENITQGWEYWVPPLILAGIAASWVMHILQYRQRAFREYYYLIYSMVLSFYHGVHETSLFDIVVISLLLMITVTLLRRPEFLKILLAEFFFLLITQTVRSALSKSVVFDSLQISRVILHCVVEVCGYLVLREVISNNEADTHQLELRNAERQREQEDMEDFLVNISHELRTPVNVINGLSTIIRKKEEREDDASICDAGFLLSVQIDDIQAYGEIRRGEVILDEDKYEVCSLINDILSDYSFYQKDNDKDLVVDLDPNVPSVLIGDQKRINKIIGHLIDNAFKFTRNGGVYLRIRTIDHDNSTNLVIEVTDTGIGMSADEIEKISRGIYQSNHTRSRSTGGIGLGLPIVYGFVRSMNGFVDIESEKGKGTTVRVSVRQEVFDPTPCLQVRKDSFFNVIYHFDPNNYKNSKVWEFYRDMAVNTASVLRINMYFAATTKDVEKLMDRGDITHIFMGEEEYLADPAFYDSISRKVTVAVSTSTNRISQNGSIILMPRPLYGYPVTRVLNGEAGVLEPTMEDAPRPVLDNVRALVVDDEPLNLIVAEGLFGEYNMIVDTALSGPEAILMFGANDYDVIFMDHMMPKMDGVEAARKIREIALRQQKTARIIALTANVVSGAKDMFMKEGFDGFIGKPIDINEFERTMRSVLPRTASGGEGGRT